MFCYCAESRRLARLLTTRYDASLAPAGLSAAQFELLSTLREMERVSGRALAAQLAVDPTTLSRNLKALLADKLVGACKSTIDARQTNYSLTARGAKRLQAAEPLWKQAHAATGKAVGDAEHTQHTLQSLTANLSR